MRYGVSVDEDAIQILGSVHVAEVYRLIRYYWVVLNIEIKYGSTWWLSTCSLIETRSLIYFRSI